MAESGDCLIGVFVTEIAGVFVSHTRQGGIQRGILSQYFGEPAGWCELHKFGYVVESEVVTKQVYHIGYLLVHTGFFGFFGKGLGLVFQ